MRRQSVFGLMSAAGAVAALFSGAWLGRNNRLAARAELIANRRRRPRRVRVYRVNGGTQASERYRRRIQAGKIPENQILRGGPGNGRA